MKKASAIPSGRIGRAAGCLFAMLILFAVTAALFPSAACAGSVYRYKALHLAFDSFEIGKQIPFSFRIASSDPDNAWLWYDKVEWKDITGTKPVTIESSEGACFRSGHRYRVDLLCGLGHSFDYINDNADLTINGMKATVEGWNGRPSQSEHRGVYLSLEITMPDGLIGNVRVPDLPDMEVGQRPSFRSGTYTNENDHWSVRYDRTDLGSRYHGAEQWYD